jgi:SAM-dependent methyltransferase
MTWRRAALLAGCAYVALILGHFPWQYGDHPDTSSFEASAGYFDNVFARPVEEITQNAQDNHESAGITADLAAFVRDYDLGGKRILDVGAGSGIFQDLVEDYTGLDIAASAARYFHKPFVVASATEMPFEDGKFDAIWTIWTLEHVPDPELALSEMRRVLGDGGLLYLHPAWNCPPWLSRGYAVRPYGDLDLAGKLGKASLPVRDNPWFQASYRFPTRSARRAAALAGPTRLRYVALEGEFEHYWQPDSTAVNSIDCYEAYLWFLSRGDRCRNCLEGLDQLRRPCGPLIIEVRKS